MSGKSPVSASEDQRAALMALAGSRDRGEADRARAILLTLSGWTSPRIAEAFSVREDTVRLWRSDFSRGGTDALKASVAPGPPPVKSETALRVVAPLLEEPVTNRPNWTIARMRAEIEAREGVRISRSQLSKALRKKNPLPAAAAHPERAASCQRGRSDSSSTRIASRFIGLLSISDASVGLRSSRYEQADPEQDQCSAHDCADRLPGALVSALDRTEREEQRQAAMPSLGESRHSALSARVGGSHQAVFLAFTSFVCVSIACWRFSAHTSSPSSTGHSSLPRGVRLYSTFGGTSG